MEAFCIKCLDCASKGKQAHPCTTLEHVKDRDVRQTGVCPSVCPCARTYTCVCCPSEADISREILPSHKDKGGV